MAAETMSTGTTASLWKSLQDSLAFASYVPAPVPHEQVEEAAFVHRSGEPYHVLKQREKLTYLSLPPDAYELWKMMDGTKPIRTIAIEYAMAHKRLVTGLLRGLVDELREKGFLQDPPARIFSRLDERRRRRTPGYWLMSLLMAIISHDLVKLRQGDALLGAAYRAGGWIFFTPAFALVMVGLLIAGFAAWVATLAAGSHSLVKTGDSYLLGFVSLLLLDALATSLHELGHALGVKYARRHVNDLGVLLYYGAPCAYVNSTDVWMADRRHRIVTSLAGPFVSLVLAASAGLVAFLASGGSLLGDLAFKGATVWFFDGILNFVPLLELDGYFVLVDLLEMPMLRARSFTFLRREAWRKLRSRARWTREERILGLFGVGAAGFSGLMLGLTVWVWNVRGVEMAAELWTLPEWYGKPLLILFLLVFAGPLVLGLATLAVSGLRAIFWRIAWRFNERRLIQRAEPVLAALPYLRQTAPAERTALAQHLRPRHVAPGAVVVRQGDPADGFYLIRSGSATVEQAGADRGVRRVATLGPGDHFGELAYLNGAPRNATVRARTSLDLYYLDGGHFRRWIGEDMRGRADVQRRMLDHATLERLPLLRGLTSSERGQLVEQMEAQQFEAGEIAFRQGDPGDRLYLIVEGRFEVLVRGADDPPDADGQPVAVLGEGAYFGEIALLNDQPRNATVRAAAPSTCYTLSREGFWRLLEAAPSGRAGLDRLARERVQETGNRLCGALGGSRS
jgi:CRP-like cAMP-binding protein